MLNPDPPTPVLASDEVPQTSTGYRCAPGVRWAVETRGLTLFHANQGAFSCIPYPFAAVWDLLHRGYRLDDATRMMSHIAGIAAPRAQKLIVTAVQGWLDLGVIRKEDVNGEHLTHFDV